MKLNKGQMMIEALIALSIVIVVLVTLMSTATLSLKNARRSKDMILANHYAQLQMEKAKAIKNRETLAVFSPAGRYKSLDVDAGTIQSVTCPDPSNCWTIYTDSTGKDTGLRGMIEISNLTGGPPVDRVKVKSVVAWTDSDCPIANVYCHQSQLESYMTQWQN